jgi:signal transduction histidine kinase
MPPLKDNIFERVFGDSVSDAGNIQACINRLSKGKSLLETIFNVMREGIIVLDIHLRIKYFNRAAKEMIGIPDDISRLRISNVLREIDWKSVIGKNRGEWTKISRREIEILYPGRRIIQFYVVPFEENKGSAVIILNDVTELRESARNELETGKTHAVSLLAAGVAHEIGNPLTSLDLHMQYLSRVLTAKKPKISEAREMLDTARTEVQRLRNIIARFLTAIRPSQPKLEPIDVKETVIETLNFMRPEIELKSVKIKCCWSDGPLKIAGDADRLKQAFYNIIKNAIEAMPSGGSLEITCACDETSVSVSFADTGPGIGPSEITGVFEPYKTGKTSGSGLGLMVVERVLREHGAELDVDSEPGQGTVFTAKFPLPGRKLKVLPPPPGE